MMTCPGCGADNDAHAGVGNLGKPDPGDVSVCAYCSMINKFTETPDGLRLRPATRTEARVLLQDKNVRAAVATSMTVRRNRRD